MQAVPAHLGDHVPVPFLGGIQAWGILHVTAAAASWGSWGMGILRVLQVSAWESMLASSVAKLLPLLKAIS